MIIIINNNNKLVMIKNQNIQNHNIQNVNVNRYIQPQDLISSVIFIILYESNFSLNVEVLIQ